MACLLLGANMDHQVVVMCLPEKELTILREDKSQKLLVSAGVINRTWAGGTPVISEKQRWGLYFQRCSNTLSGNPWKDMRRSEE